MPGALKEGAPVTMDSPAYAARVVVLGEFTVAFETIKTEHDAAPFFKSLPGDRCPCPHWGLVVTGHMVLHYSDHEETFEAGDAYYAPPGHVPAVTSGTELVEFSPAEAFAETMAVVARNLAAGVGAR